MDLTETAPRSPATRLGNYAILARCLDKGRAEINGNVGEYHFDCPLDNMLFDFKEVKGADIRKLLEDGTTDADVVTWLNGHGAGMSPQEIGAWSDQMEAYKPYENPEKKEWFAEQVAPLGLDPATTTLFEWLEADDNASYEDA